MKEKDIKGKETEGKEMKLQVNERKGCKGKGMVSLERKGKGKESKNRATKKVGIDTNS